MKRRDMAYVCWRLKHCVHFFPNAATVSLSISLAFHGHSPPPHLLHQHRNEQRSVESSSSTTLAWTSQPFFNMFINSGAVKNSCKRKMKEVAVEAIHQTPPPTTNRCDDFNLQSQGQILTLGPSSSITPNINDPYLQSILNASPPPQKPFFFTSLFTDVLENEDNDLPFLDLNIQTQQIDQIISFHSENMKRSLMETMEKQQHEMEERAAKKLKQKEAEMNVKKAESEVIIEHYKTETQRLTREVRRLAYLEESLTASLEEALSARWYTEAAQEEVDSSFMGPIMLACQACKSEVATMMMWPCRHVCVCKQCEARTKICLVCGKIATTTVEIRLPNN